MTPHVLNGLTPGELGDMVSARVWVQRQTEAATKAAEPRAPMTPDERERSLQQFDALIARGRA